MPEDLIELLRQSDPAAAPDPGAGERDALIWADLRTRQATPRRPRRASRWLAIAAASALALGVIAFGLGRDRRPGGDFDASAKTFQALQRTNVLYHFRSTARLTETPAGVAQSYGVPFLFPSVGPSRGGQPSNHEVWITPGGRQVRWVRYRGAAGARSGLLAAYAFLQRPRQVRVSPRKDLPRLRSPTCHRTGIAEPPSALPTPGGRDVGPPSDPATAFVVAYCARRIESKGATVFDGRAVWRFVSRPTAHGSQQEWLVDRKSWLPVRYRYVDHNQQAGRRYTARLTVRFLAFEVLPLDATNARLLHLTPSEREVCQAAKVRGLARARVHLSPRRYRMAVAVMRQQDDCR